MVPATPAARRRGWKVWRRTDTNKHRQTDTNKHRQTDRHKHRQTDTNKHRHKQTQTDRHKQTHTTHTTLSSSLHTHTTTEVLPVYMCVGGEGARDIQTVINIGNEATCRLCSATDLGALPLNVQSRGARFAEPLPTYCTPSHMDLSCPRVYHHHPLLSSTTQQRGTS